MTGTKSSIFTIPAGIPFARTLARTLLEETGADPLALSRYRLLLPTRRACRTVREAFLRETDGKPLLLPHLQTLGDIDEDELDFSYTGAGGSDLADTILNLPPPLPPIQRQIFLARAIMAKDGHRQGPEHAMMLAAELGRLMDHIYTENLDLSDLADLVDADFAAHWQITLDFLKILSREWPGILKKTGMMDQADRRNRLILALADHWADTPPKTPVIAAGSTGSIPAAAALMKVIAGLPQGRIVLPGLDTAMDEESWDSLDDTHPQATLKNLLTHLDVARDCVSPWPVKDEAARLFYIEKRQALATEMMRPASTTHEWESLTRLDDSEKETFTATLDGIMRADCETVREEARLIALMMRETLETPKKTAALVTPDRELARRVAMICERWGIQIDDSAGQDLPDTVIGSFLRITAKACIERLSPTHLLAMLRHKFTRIGMRTRTIATMTAQLEKGALRGLKPPPGLEGLKTRLADEEIVKKLPGGMGGFIDQIGAALSPFLEYLDSESHPFPALLDAHITVAESLAATEEKPGAEILWAREDGEAAATFLARLREVSSSLPDVTAAQYLAILEELMKTVTVRPAYGTHPRLSILGQLEARLLQADLVILGGLNEGVWPPDPGYDPWMSRPMKAKFGLPGPERRIGLSSHDFVQGFCAPDVVLTRSKRRDGAPTVPARWLQRLDTVLLALGSDTSVLTARADLYLALGEYMDYSPEQTPCARPQPAPPLPLRPRHLSVTQIETLMGDPYSTYARHILGLEKLDPLEKQPDAADRGTVLHKVMEMFLKKCGQTLPPREEALKLLHDIGHDLIGRRTDDPGFWDFWWPRFENLCEWIVDHEIKWRKKAKPLAAEVKGLVTVKAPAGPFTVSARADRIDRLADGSAAIIDYKSGGSFSKTAMKTGSSPQLPLEALMANDGGFETMTATIPGYIGYWVMTGGHTPGDITALSGDLGAVVETAAEGIKRLVSHYDNVANCYHSLPDPDRAPRYNDYEHLARVQEWSAHDDTAESG